MCVSNYAHFHLNLYKSKIRYRRLRDKFNQGKQYCERLTGSHDILIERMLFIYRASISYQEAYGEGLQKGQELPSLYTNNIFLSREINRSVNTIINLRRRLKSAGIITAEVFHGCNSQYEVFFNPDILHVNEKGQAKNLIADFSPNYQPPPTQKNIATPQKLGHIVSSTVSRQGTYNKLIKLSGVDSQQVTDTEQFKPLKPVRKCVETSGKPQNHVENQHSSEVQATNQELGSGYETNKTKSGRLAGCAAAAAKKPEKGGVFVGKDGPPPQRIGEVLALLTPENAEKVKIAVQVMWPCALNNLYKGKYIAESEKTRAKAVLAEYLAYASPSKYNAGVNEVIERISLVRKWIDRAPEGERWVALPSSYFDHRNKKHGFVNTKDWCKKHRASKWDIANRIILTKAMNTYTKAIQPGSTLSVSEVYRKCKQTLGKRDPELVILFHEFIQKLKNESNTNKSDIKPKRAQKTIAKRAI